MINKKVVTLSSLVLVLLLVNVVSFAQCRDDTHSTNQADSWVSCESSPNPNTFRGDSHWVLYDLGYMYQLGIATIWNYNVENETGKGFKDVLVDYSINGIDWITAGQFQLPQASGNNNYTGYRDFDFGDIGARYILLTAQNNWDGSGCAGISEFKVEVNGSPLPIDLLEFLAQPKEDYISLNWKTRDEINFSHFEIERSVDATSFSFLDQVQGNNDNNTNAYQLDDLNVKKGQLYYYRLKIVDLDGRFEYGPIRAAQIKESLEFSIYPNPTVNVLHISFAENFAKEIIIQNSTGHEVQRIKVKENMHHLDTSLFPAGIYFCSVLSGGAAISTKRFVKVE